MPPSIPLANSTGRAGVFKARCKGHSAKRITLKNRLSAFFTPAPLSIKTVLQGAWSELHA